MANRRITKADDQLWDQLEEALRSYRNKGTALRTNLVPDGARDKWGYLVEKSPSDRIKEGPIFDLCRRMNPGFARSMRSR